MVHYIDKSALVAWIENQIDSLERNSGCSGIFGEFQMAVYDKLYSFLDTLDVLTLDDIKEMENQAFLHGIDVEKNQNIFNNNEKIKI